MTLISYTGLVDAMSGKMGGSSFQKTRVGIMLRNNKFHPGTPSPSQQAVRKNFFVLINLWQSLTDDQRKKWHDSAALINCWDSNNTLYHPSGYNYFMSCNQNLFIAGYYPHLSPALPYVMDREFIWSIAPNMTIPITFKIVFHGQTTNGNFTYSFAASGPISPAKNGFDNNFCTLFALPGGFSNEYNFTFFYQRKYGGFQSKKNFTLRLHIIDNASGLLILESFASHYVS